MISVAVAGGDGLHIQGVYIDYDKEADFSKYRTYAWAQGTPTKNQLMDRRIVSAIDEHDRKEFPDGEYKSGYVCLLPCGRPRSELFHVINGIRLRSLPGEQATGDTVEGLGCGGVGLSTGTATPVTVVKARSSWTLQGRP
ncbi:MAG: DUF4136 domain-containing protein [Nitrospirales bacterium]|nr:DUF4136 domain-containing protein [Nitrospirales bacterium]